MHQHNSPSPIPTVADERISKRRRTSAVNSSAISITSITNLSKEDRHSTSPPPSVWVPPHPSRHGCTYKRREVSSRNTDNKMICTVDEGCNDITFNRKCEWHKHMDKHERPYRCDRAKCSKLQGFTYGGGLTRHQREVHNMHGGTGERLFCPEANCKRNAGSGFARKENLQEYLRRVHRRVYSASSDAATLPKTKDDGEASSSLSEKDSHVGSLATTMKRNRDGTDPVSEEYENNTPDSHEEIRRLKEQNRELMEQMLEHTERLERLEEMAGKV